VTGEQQDKEHFLVSVFFHNYYADHCSRIRTCEKIGLAEEITSPVARGTKKFAPPKSAG
jgi:hypothetical protein